MRKPVELGKIGPIAKPSLEIIYRDSAGSILRKSIPWRRPTTDAALTEYIENYGNNCVDSSRVKCDDLPYGHSWLYREPELLGDYLMEFRLVYKGTLAAETSRPRPDNKRKIRSALHPQLLELWKSHPRLKSEFEGQRYKEPPGYPSTEELVSFSEHRAERNKVVSVGNHIHRFVPLVTEENYSGCSLDILFLRRDTPGGIVKHGGDIDNRLKVLLDALRMPRETQELEDCQQSPDENPCFCLLADDKYIDQIAVTTDRLLSPMETGDAIHDVMLVIHVVLSLYNPMQDFAPI